jgi:hypothetical protein
MSIVQCHEDGNGYSNSFNALKFLTSVRVSIVGTATRCGLDSPGCESRWGKRDLLFFISFQTGPGTYPASYSMGLLDPEDNITLLNVGNQSTECNILEDLNLYQHRCENIRYSRFQIVNETNHYQ